VALKVRESSLWQWLKQAEKVYGDLLHMERIENSVGSGTPDVHGCLNGKQFTIELKAVRRSKMITCGLRESQVWWALRRKMASGNHWFLIQVGDERYLIKGALASVLDKPIEYEELSALGVLVFEPMDVIAILA
jgi:hypothetical protein